MKSDDIPLHLKVEEALKQIFVESLDNIITYSSIPDITSLAHLDTVKELIYSQQETTMDKLMLH